jgi:hypothetical protein
MGIHLLLCVSSIDGVLRKLGFLFASTYPMWLRKPQCGLFVVTLCEVC